MITDPSVSKRKFEREVATARAHKPFHKQGVWIMRSEYPLVFAVLVTANKMPLLHGVLCGVHIDFTDFDVRPPSIKFVDPFDETPLSYEACWKFSRFTPNPIQSHETPQHEVTHMLQAFDTNKPFLCLPGVREYHETSAHTGDSWFLHRQKNMLVHLLTILQRYGSNQPSFQMQITPLLVSQPTL